MRRGFYFLLLMCDGPFKNRWFTNGFPKEKGNSIIQCPSPKSGMLTMVHMYVHIKYVYTKFWGHIANTQMIPWLVEWFRCWIWKLPKVNMLKYVTCGWTFRVDPHHRSTVPNEIWGFFGCKTRRNPAVETTSPPNLMKMFDFGATFLFWWWQWSKIKNWLFYITGVTTLPQ